MTNVHLEDSAKRAVALLAAVILSARAPRGTMDSRDSASAVVANARTFYGFFSDY